MQDRGEPSVVAPEEKQIVWGQQRAGEGQTRPHNAGEMLTRSRVVSRELAPEWTAGPAEPRCRAFWGLQQLLGLGRPGWGGQTLGVISR